jgi:hypothetical protein
MPQNYIEIFEQEKEELLKIIESGLLSKKVATSLSIKLKELLL